MRLRTFVRSGEGLRIAWSLEEKRSITVENEDEDPSYTRDNETTDRLVIIVPIRANFDFRTNRNYAIAF